MSEIPQDYCCEKCGLRRCKLWREYESWCINLLCAECAGKDQKKDISQMDADGSMPGYFPGNRTTQIGWLIPAIPTLTDNKMKGYWGFANTPADRMKWWMNLPNKK